MFRYRPVSVIFFSVFTATACAPRDTAEGTESGVFDTYDSLVTDTFPQGDSRDSPPVETGDTSETADTAVSSRTRSRRGTVATLPRLRPGTRVRRPTRPSRHGHVPAGGQSRLSPG